jgi:serine protein kinase
MQEGEDKDAESSKKVRLYAGEEVEGVPRSEIEKMPREDARGRLSGVSPRFVINALSNAIIQSHAHSLTSMEVLLALKDSIESDARMDAKKKRKWVDFLVVARKDFYNRWVKEDVHKALFVSFEQEAQELLNKYLDEVEATLDNRQVKDRSPTRSASRRAVPALGRGQDQDFRVRQALVPPGGGAQGDGRVQARREVHARQPRPAARCDRAVSVRAAARRAAPRQLDRAPGRGNAQKISVVEKRLADEYGYDSHSAREASTT